MRSYALFISLALAGSGLLACAERSPNAAAQSGTIVPVGSSEPGPTAVAGGAGGAGEPSNVESMAVAPEAAVPDPVLPPDAGIEEQDDTPDDVVEPEEGTEEDEPEAEEEDEPEEEEDEPEEEEEDEAP